MTKSKKASGATPAPTPATPAASSGNVQFSLAIKHSLSTPIFNRIYHVTGFIPDQKGDLSIRGAILGADATMTNLNTDLPAGQVVMIKFWRDAGAGRADQIALVYLVDPYAARLSKDFPLWNFGASLRIESTGLVYLTQFYSMADDRRPNPKSAAYLAGAWLLKSRMIPELPAPPPIQQMAQQLAQAGEAARRILYNGPLGTITTNATLDDLSRYNYASLPQAADNARWNDVVYEIPPAGTETGTWNYPGPPSPNAIPAVRGNLNGWELGSEADALPELPHPFYWSNKVSGILFVGNRSGGPASPMLFCDALLEALGEIEGEQAEALGALLEAQATQLAGLARVTEITAGLMKSKARA